MAMQIQVRRGTATQWTSANPTLADGEMGYETDTRKFKFGDGTTAWTSLPYASAEASGVEFVSSLPATGEANTLYINTTDDTLHYYDAEWIALGGGGGLEDAPEDGEIYGRKDGAWEVIPNVESFQTISQLAVSVAPTVEETGTVTTVAGTSCDIGGTHTADEFAGMFLLLQYAASYSVHRITANTTAGVLTLNEAISTEESDVDYDVIDPYAPAIGENDYHIRTTTPNVVELPAGNSNQQVIIAVDGSEPVYMYDGTTIREITGKELFTYNTGWI